MPLRSSLAVLVLSAGAAAAAQVGPPMFDITRQCDAASHRNASAMSECVVAESEARAQLLQHWSSYSDDGAERCIKAGRKAQRHPYAVMAKCMSGERPAAATGAAK